MNILIICISVIVCYGMYLFYQWKNPYADEIVESIRIEDSKGDMIAKALLIKRIYKNGKTVFVNKKYE